MIQESLFKMPDVYTFELKRGFVRVVFTGYVYAKCVECPTVFPLTLYRLGDRVVSHDKCPACRGEAPRRQRRDRWDFPISGAKRIVLTNAYLMCTHCGEETQLQLRHMTSGDEVRNQPRCSRCRNL